MKRKVNRVGVSTLTISLPSKWAKKHNVSKGDLLDLTEKNSTLILSLQPVKKESRKISIDITGMPTSLIWRYLYSAYIAGFDEIEVHFQKTTTKYTGRRKHYKEGESLDILDVLYSICSVLSGFEIIRQSKNCCVMKELGRVEIPDFEQVMKRIIFLVNETAKELAQYMKTRDRAVLQSIVLREDNINKFCNLCLRTLNNAEDFSQAKSRALQKAVLFIEDIADRYLAIAARYKFGKSSKRHLIILNHANSLLAKMYDILFGKVDLCKLRSEAMNKLDKLIVTAKPDTVFIPNIKHFQENFKEFMQCRIDLEIINKAA